MKRLSRLAFVLLIFAFALPELAQAQIKINEIKVKGTEFIELYNPTGAAVSVANWTLNATTGGFSITLTGSVPAGGFRTWTNAEAPPDSLPISFMSNDGDVVELRNAFATIIDDVGYGTMGGAPFAFNSTGRFPNGQDTDNWAQDWEYLDDAVVASPESPDSTNQQGEPALGTSLILNEIDPQGTAAGAFDRLEIYNPTGGAINLQGYWICDGDGYCRINNSILLPAGGRIGLTESTAGEGMDCIGVDAIDYGASDVAYLFNPSGTRIDQLGIQGRPNLNADESLQRCPDGAGPHNAYNYATQGGGTTFRRSSDNFGGTNNSECVSPPPSFVDLARTPCAPVASQAASVSVVALRATTASIRYRVNNGAESSVTMTLNSTSGDTTRWSGNIPGQAGSPLVEYYVRLINATPDTTESFLRGYFVGTVANIGVLRVNDSEGRNIYDGYGARIQGNVTVPPGIYQTANVDFYIQDSVSGINVFYFGTHAHLNSLALTYGNLITVAGEIDQFNGKLEITKGGDCDTLLVDLDGPGAVPAAQTVRSCDLGEAHEGELVRFDDAFFIFENGGDTLKINTNYLLSNCFPGKEMRIEDFTGIGGTILPGTAGDTIRTDAIGVCVQFDSAIPYDSGYQLTPRRTSDLTFTNSQVGVGDGVLRPIPQLLQNAPNPWGNSTSILFQVPEPGDGGDQTPVRLSLFDLQGRLVRTLIDSPMEPGDHALDLRSETLDVANGIYFYTLETGGTKIVRKMMVAR